MLVKKTIKGIVAIGDGNVIGREGTLPWRRIDEDMTYFYRKTRGCAVVFGRRTALGMQDVFPLKERENLVLSTQAESAVRNELKGEYKICDSWKEVFDKCESDTVWVCGGSEVYSSGAKFIDEFHVSRIRKKHFTQDKNVSYTRWSFPTDKTWVLKSRQEKENVCIEIYRRI